MSDGIRAPRGRELSCKGWQQEAALRMLMNSLDDEVARDLAVCGGARNAPRDRQHYDAIVRLLRALENDETLVVESDKAGVVFRTHEGAPRVLAASITPGLTPYRPASAGGWMDIGAQGVLADTYETFAAARKKHFGGDLSGKLVVSGGMGSRGGAQPLGATLNGAAFLGIEADVERITRSIRAGFCDYCVNDLSEALRILKKAVRQREAVSVGLAANCAEVIPELVRRGVAPDLVTDQTGAHDPLNGYIPSGLSLEQAERLRTADPEEYLKRSYESIARHVAGMLELQRLGSTVFEYGNNIREAAFENGGVKNAYDFPEFVTAYLHPLICEGRGPLRWVALSGDAADILRMDDLVLELFSGNQTLARWIQLARSRVKFQGLPARAGWLGSGESAQLGLRLNQLVARGELNAPVVIGRERPDLCPAALSTGETEWMSGGRDAIARWPLLDALLSTASGASWVWIDGGGSALRTGQAVVADGSREMARRIERALGNDAAASVVRYAGAGSADLRF